MSAAARRERRSDREQGETLAVLRLLIVLPLLLCTAVETEGAWVMDYASGTGRCCGAIPVEACEPSEAASNRACMDVCHYGGCRKGGQCEYVGGAVPSLGLGAGRACRCNC